MPQIRSLTLAALLGVAGAQATTASPAAPFALPLTVRIPATPPKPKYCTPVAYRDYEVMFGRSAFVRPIPGCQGPARIRKVSDITGQADPPLTIHLPTANEFPVRVWLFVSHLEYTLDGSLWRRLRLIP